MVTHYLVIVSQKSWKVELELINKCLASNYTSMVDP